jgi:hypothetical protein
MFSKSMLAMAKSVMEADVNYGARFSKVPILDPKAAQQRLEPGDILVQFVPQLSFEPEFFNEYLLKGCMHIATAALFGDRFYKIELVQQGLFVFDDLFSDIEREPVFMKRYSLVLRHKRLKRHPDLQHAVNESALLLAGFEDREGVPVRVRQVRMNFYLKTNRLEGKKRHLLPKKLYCSELTYQAYKVNGIDLCPLKTMEELVKDLGGPPNLKYSQQIAQRYAHGSRLTYFAIRAITEWERLAYLFRLPSCLHLTRIFMNRVAWPHVILENPEVEIAMMIPPPEPFIVQWERTLQQVGSVPDPERVRPTFAPRIAADADDQSAP